MVSDPSLGRFITPDTIVQDPSNPVTLNRYQYSGNNPVNNIDPGNEFRGKNSGGIPGTRTELNLSCPRKDKANKKCPAPLFSISAF